MRGVAPALGDRAHPVRRQRDHDRRHGPERLGRDHQPRGRQERLDHDRRARRLVAPRGRGPERGPDGRRRGPTPSRSRASARRTIPTIPAFDDATAAAGPVQRRDGVKAALDRARGRGPQRLGLLRDRRPLAGDRQQEGQLRVPPLDVRRVFDHDAHRRRHRLGLRAVGLAAAVRSRRGRARRARREKGRVVGQAARPAPGRVHRDPRARGGRRPARCSCSSR